MSLDDAPPWRREPYRWLFPLGVALAWAGVLPWLRYAVSAPAPWRPLMHSTVQIQGFMTCFALGFLFTAIPRRTGTAAPGALPLLVGAGGAVGSAAAASAEWHLGAQAGWMVAVGALLAFAIRRFRSPAASRRPPTSFVWIPCALLLGLAGAGTMMAYGRAHDSFTAYRLGQLLVTQGVFVGLVVGVGGMVIRLITRGESPPDASPSPIARRARALHLAAAIALASTFAIEALGHPRLGAGLRAPLTLAVLLRAADLHRRPTLPGAHRWLVWLSAWAIPLGYALAASLPRQTVGLHVVFIAGFGMMALAIGLHVTCAHGGRQDLARASPVYVRALGALLVAATVARALQDLDAPRMRVWMGTATGCFLLASVMWGIGVLRVHLTPRG